MKIQLVTKTLSDISSDYLIYPVFEEGKNNIPNALVTQFLTENPKFGKLFESQLLYSKDRKIILLGIGKKEKVNFEKLQNWVGCAVKQVMYKSKNVTMTMPAVDTLDAESVGEALAIGAEIVTHDPAKDYKSKVEAIKLTSLEVVIEKADKGFQSGVKKGQIVAESMNIARKLSDMPANDLTPTAFLNVVRKIARENKLKLTVLDEKMARKKGMGAFAGVAQGSDEPSYMIALEYKGDIKNKEKWGLVGKGITFDSGGTSLKPSSGMLDMKYDMCGAAAVLATVVALARLGSKANVVAIMPVTENLISGRAQRIRDIVKSYSGKTVEITNTDAEGRLVLIDGLTYAQRDFKATRLIDVSTLTGAIIVALGSFITGVFGNNPIFTQGLIVTGTKVGERYWEMPMDEEFNELIKSDFADMQNAGTGSTAGSIFGAKFIESAIENNRPWIHLDIAGTAWDMGKKPFRGVGATGVSVKTLIHFIENGKGN